MILNTGKNPQVVVIVNAKSAWTVASLSNDFGHVVYVQQYVSDSTNTWPIYLHVLYFK